MIESSRGPKRSEASRQAIFVATRELLLTDGYDRLSIEAIARRAGVGKQTIYRWWSSKAAVIVDAVLDGYIQAPSLPELTGGDLYDNLHVWAQGWREQTGSPLGRALTQALTTAAAADAAAAAQLYGRFTGPLREQLCARFAESGDLRPDADHLAAADAIIGPFIFLALSRQPVDERYARGVIDIVLHGLRRRPEDVAPERDPS